MVALAFLIPLGLVVQLLAKERALADAERQTAVVVAVLTVTTDPNQVDRAIATTGGPAVQRVSVHDLPGESDPVGDRHASQADVNLAAGQAAPYLADVPGGVSYLEPVDIGTGRTVVVEVYIPESELRRGVSGAWWALGRGRPGAGHRLGVGRRPARRARRRLGPQLASAAVALGEGELDVRVTPSGPRELAEAGYAFNVMADRMVGAAAANERELVADLSHRLRTPLTALRLDAETLDDSQDAERIRYRDRQPRGRDRQAHPGRPRAGRGRNRGARGAGLRRQRRGPRPDEVLVGGRRRPGARLPGRSAWRTRLR